MSTAVSPRQVFHESLERCTASDDFIPKFYRRFLAVSDEIRAEFHSTSFENQKRMLLRSLYLVAAATDGDPDGLRELKDRAETHDREHLNICPVFYDTWRTSVIQTAAAFDCEWNEGVQQAWEHILDFATSYMVRRY